jgi:hypothetical protein
MTDAVDPSYAARLVDELERRIDRSTGGDPLAVGRTPSLADAPDGAPNVPGVPEPPD